MGAKFTNVQVLCEGADVAAFHARVVAAVRERLGRSGLRELAEGDPERAVRTAVIGPPGRWIAIYDQDTEDLDDRKLEQLAAAISVALAAPSVSVLVFDSDLLALGLFDRGRRIGEFVRDPEHPRRRPKAADLAPWERVALPGKDAKDVASALAGHEVFVEEKVGELADVLGWEVERVSVGFEYLKDVDLDGLTTLRFGAQPAESASGAAEPSLRLSSVGGPSEVIVGQQVHAHVAVRNDGATVTGLAVVAWGPAADAGLVRPLAALVRLREGRRTGAFHEAGFELREVGSVRMWVARFPDLELDREVHAGIRAEVGAEGAAPLCLAVAAIGRPLDPGAVGVFRVLAKLPEPELGPLRRPLRCERSIDPHRAESTRQQLKVLAAPRVLVAGAVLGADRGRAAPLVTDAFERWHELATSPRPRAFRVEAMTGSATQRSSVLTAGRLAGSAEWQASSKMLARSRSWVASTSQPGGSPSLGTNLGDGFAWETESILGSEGEGTFMPHVVLWLSLDGLEPAAVSRAEKLAAEILDALIDGAKGLQAFVARWAWAPSLHRVIANPYEAVCGIPSEYVTDRAWNGRFLRAVGEQIWLGHDLMKRLASVDLDSVAEVETLGAATRLRLREGRTLDDLESLLAPILPDSTDAAKASETYWAARRAEAVTPAVRERAVRTKPSEPRKVRKDVERSLVALHTGSDRSKVNAITRLASLAAVAPAEAVEGLRLALASTSRKVRIPAAQALATVAAHAPPEARALVLATRADPDWMIRAESVAGLEALAQKDRSLLPVIEELLGDSSAEVRGTALGALQRSGLDREALERHALGVLGSRGNSAKLSAVSVLRRIGTRSPEVLAAMATALRAQDDQLGAGVARAIGALFPGVDAAAALHAALPAAGQRARVAILEALGQLGSAASAAVPDLLAALESSEVLASFAAAVALARIDPARREPLPLLERALADPRGSGRRSVEAAEAILRIQPERSDLIELLVDAARTPDDRAMVQVAAARSLGALGLRAAIPVLTGLLDERNPESLRSAAKAALAAIEAR